MSEAGEERHLPRSLCPSATDGGTLCVRRVYSRGIPRTFVVIALLALTSCGSREVASSLSAKRSLDMVALLHEAGISAERERVGTRQESYLVSVPGAQYEEALREIHRFGLIPDAEDEVGALLASRPFAPDHPEIVQMRADRVRAAQLEQILEYAPGVRDARVVIRREGKEGVVVTVVVRSVMRPDHFISEDEVRALVTQVIPRVEPQGVLVKRFELLPASLGERDALQLTEFFPFSFQVRAEDRRSASLELGLLVIGGVLSALGFGYSLGRMSGERRDSGRKRSDGARSESTRSESTRSESARARRAEGDAEQSGEGTQATPGEGSSGYTMRMRRALLPSPTDQGPAAEGPSRESPGGNGNGSSGAVS